MSVFTFFNHGTAFDRDSNETELVTVLHDSIQGNEARLIQVDSTDDNPLGYRIDDSGGSTPNFLINEGPGSDTVSEDKSRHGVAHSRTGVTNTIFGGQKGDAAKHNPLIEGKGRKKYGIAGKRKLDSFQKDFMGDTSGSPSGVRGKVLGTGWNDNVYRATWMLSHLIFERGQSIDTVNMVGWSRGGVTCLKIANKLNEVFPDIKVNIFAADPVPGLFDPRGQGTDTYQVPPNVKNYMATLALHDFRKTFRPTDREVLELLPGANPNMVFLPLPGTHSEVVIPPTAEKIRKFPERGKMRSAEISIRLAFKFLEKFGTPFQSGKPSLVHGLSPADLTELYQEVCMYQDTACLRSWRSASATFSGTAATTAWQEGLRDIFKNRHHYAPKGFINLHHYLCYKAAIRQPTLPNEAAAEGRTPDVKDSSFNW